MKYLCLGYFDPAKTEGLSKTDLDALMSTCGPHMTKLYATERVIVDAGLDVKATIMRRVNGKVEVRDGPFAESKEMVGGAFIIDADDMDDAVRIAGLHPTTALPAGEGYGWVLEITSDRLLRNAEKARRQLEMSDAAVRRRASYRRVSQGRARRRCRGPDALVPPACAGVRWRSPT